MQTLADLSDVALQSCLAGEGLRMRVGPYIYCLRSREPLIFRGLRTLYQDFEVVAGQGFSDYHIALLPSGLLQRTRKKLEFYSDAQRPFSQIDANHAYAFLEWGMNWCVSMGANEYLKLHAAVLEKNNIALIMPGLPGAGKSTLCAALALSGWRVLSDEHALIPLHSADVVPLYRPVSLKNESIDVIRRFDSSVVYGPETEDTHKGTVVHMKADLTRASHDVNPVPARLMIFPQYQHDGGSTLKEKSKAESFMLAALHSFNYSLLADVGFDTLATCMDAVDCYDLVYKDLDKAIVAIEQIVSELSSPEVVAG